MLLTGFSEVIGSWKIIAIRVPRISLISLELAFRISLPSNFTDPSCMAFLLSTSPMTDRQVTLLPEPDSPTMPSVSHFSSEKLTPDTALTIPSSVLNHVWRSLTSSRAIRTAGFAGRGTRTRCRRSG